MSLKAELTQAMKKAMKAKDTVRLTTVRMVLSAIKNKEIGYYVVAQFEAETALLSEFERIIKLDDTVLRYLVVINEGLSVNRPDHGDSAEDSDGEHAHVDDESDAVPDAPKPPVETEPASDVDGEEEEDQPTTTSGGGE